jgi:hypothetical protein
MLVSPLDWASMIAIKLLAVRAVDEKKKREGGFLGKSDATRFGGRRTGASSTGRRSTFWAHALPSLMPTSAPLKLGIYRLFGASGI